MNKKGNPNKSPKRIRRLQKRKVTRKYGFIPKRKHYCIICKLIDGTINRKDLTVHHDKPKSEGGSNKPKNLELLCEKHHKQLHHKYFYKKVKRIYNEYRKAKFNKIQTS